MPEGISGYGSPEEAPPTMGPLASVQREEEERQSALERTIGGMNVGKAGRISSGNIVYYRDPKTGTIHGISKGSQKKAGRLEEAAREAGEAYTLSRETRPEGGSPEERRYREALGASIGARTDASFGGKDFQQIDDYINEQEGGLDMTPETLKMLTELKALQAKRRQKGPKV
jgi:hypothetical protein